MKSLRFSRIPLILLILTLGIGLVAGSSSLNWTFAQEDEDLEDVPAGFKLLAMPPMPSAEDIEAGKRVYFTKCVWCHGVDGAGDGPAADRLWPRPRNFNQGTFKIRHTASGELPLPDKDLLLTVTHGLPGSAMPSWEGILTDQQKRQVLAFVITNLVKDRQFDDEEFETFTTLQIDQLEPIPPTEDSIKKGAELFVQNKCFECHGVSGRGDGNAFNLKDDWGFPIQPADQTKCWNFRGSRQDPYNVRNIFRTFSTGVNGTPMPSFADNTTIEERWHLSNFVQSLCTRGRDGEPLPIDRLTDKPKIKVVTPAVHIPGEIPSDPNDDMWKEPPGLETEECWPCYIPLGGQITHKPRNFVNRIDDIWVRSLYNDTEIGFMFQWNDRSKSVADGEFDFEPYEVNLKDYGVVEQAPVTGEQGSIAAKQNRYTLYNDALAIQFPIKWQELPPPEKPRFFWGNEKFPVDIVKWEASGTLRAFTGTGWDQDFEDREDFDELIKVLNAEWEDGMWTVIISRPLKPFLDPEDPDATRDGYAENTWFEAGMYIPTNYFVWDGHNGDVGRKLAVSSFFYTFLKPDVPMTVYLYPVLIALGVVGLEGWVIVRRSNKKKGKTL
ncbi:MAG: c-type cytochrome [Nitrospirales bacterium]